MPNHRNKTICFRSFSRKKGIGIVMSVLWTAFFAMGKMLFKFLRLIIHMSIPLLWGTPMRKNHQQWSFSDPAVITVNFFFSQVKIETSNAWERSGDSALFIPRMENQLRRMLLKSSLLVPRRKKLARKMWCLRKKISWWGENFRSLAEQNFLFSCCSNERRTKICFLREATDAIFLFAH